MTLLTIATWNVEWRQRKVKPRIRDVGADVWVITEGRPTNLPAKSNIITSNRSHPNHRVESVGGRKVVMWSRYGWQHVDNIGSDMLPPGRFLAATVPLPDAEPLHIIGVCIPYRSYRSDSRYWTGDDHHSVWEGSRRFMEGLEQHVLTNERYATRTVILGDFNLQIPPEHYPSTTHWINDYREAAFAGRDIITAGLKEDGKPLIDHVALTPDLGAVSVETFSRYAEDGSRYSDHPAIVVQLEV